MSEGEGLRSPGAVGVLHDTNVIRFPLLPNTPIESMESRMIYHGCSMTKLAAKDEERAASVAIADASYTKLELSQMYEADR